MLSALAARFVSTSTALATCRHRTGPARARHWLLLLFTRMSFLFAEALLQKIPSGCPCRLQTEALQNLRADTDTFLQDADGVFDSADWENLMKAPTLSYTGGEVHPAEDLDAQRLAESFTEPRH